MAYCAVPLPLSIPLPVAVGVSHTISYCTNIEMKVIRYKFIVYTKSIL